MTTTNTSVFQRLRGWARHVKQETYALYLAANHPRTPWYAKACAICVAGYALSPIDLIPDPIPVLGYLDDVIIVPLGIALTIKLIPPEVMAECREQARNVSRAAWPVSRFFAGVIVGLWLLAAAGVVLFFWRLFR